MRLHRKMSRQVLNVSRVGDSTTSLGSLFQCSVTYTEKKFLLKFKWNLLCSSLNPLPLVLPLVVTELESFSLNSSLSYTSPFMLVQRDGEWGAIRPVHSNSFLLLLPLHTFPCGFFPQAVVLQDKPVPIWHPPWAAAWKSALTWSSPLATKEYLLHCGLFHWLQGNLCSST